MIRVGIALCAAVMLLAPACGRRKAVADGSAGGDAAGADFTPFQPAPIDAVVPERSAPVDAAPDASDGRDGADAWDGSADNDASDAGNIDASDAGADGDASRTDASSSPEASQSCRSPIPCDPYACNAGAGSCKTSCTGPEDCAAGKTCTRGSCGVKESWTCTAAIECASGFCAQGVCCDSACQGPCRSCALPGSSRVCTPVPEGSPDPQGFCTAGQQCDGHGACAAPMACAADAACPRFNRCSAGRCVPCNATCASSADCAFGAICADGNGCTFCTPRDAGAALP